MTTHDWGEADIAVVGMAGRFPGAPDIETFWHNLCNGVESIHFPDDDELAALGVDAAALKDPQYVKAASVVEGVDLFDAAFFGYTPREAELMDPQHRLFLECATHALEHAGYDPDRYRGAIGVFGGGTTNTYLLYNLVSNRDVLRAFDPMQIDVSNGADFIATRVSYKLNLKGPSFTVQTACSTSLLAIHMACQSLLNEECDLALAGGVSVHVKHSEGYWYADGGNVSPDGHCRAFDAQGSGTIFGSGVAIVVLKRVADAIADGDHIHAIVKGSAINNDGAVKVGFTAPSVEGQAGVITEALALADVKADSIRYVETHGTATKLGDPIEIRALTKAFRTHTDARQFCAIGSVKTNVGHLASAAGVTSFIKTVLALEHGVIPPSLHFERPNAEIDFASSPFFVNTRLSPWPEGAVPRRAGVSSFGVGGTNAHAVLEAPPVLGRSGPSRPAQLLVLSAKTPGALATMSANLAAHLRRFPDCALADVAYTLQVGRQVFHQRQMVVCADREAAIAALESGDAQRVLRGVTEVQDRPVVFMFPGMGDQYVDMALELYQVEPTFRAQVDRCAEILLPLIGVDVRMVLYPQGTQPRASSGHSEDVGGDLRRLMRRGGGDGEPRGGVLGQTRLAHPIIFTVEYALAQVWMGWGIRPRVMIGHSIGEYVAACVAGVFSLEDALRVIARRAELIQGLPEGAMLAVLLPEEQVRPWLGDRLSLAAVNMPMACVVSGYPDAVAALEQRLLETGVACQRVQAGHAFHSVMMEPIVEPLLALLRQVRLRPPTIPFFSNVHGAQISAEEAMDPAYWAQHMRQTVRFAEGAQALLDQPSLVLLELGPGQTLASLVKQHPAHTTAHVVVASLRPPHQSASDVAFLLQVLGRLWLAGVEVAWAKVYAQEKRRRVPLPGYPFERQRYWIAAGATGAPVVVERHMSIDSWFYHPSWRRSVPPRVSPTMGEVAVRRWLVFADAGGMARELAVRLGQVGQAVVLVFRGERFGQLDDGSYMIDPRRREDYGALLRACDALGMRPGGVVHCMGLDHEPTTGGRGAIEQLHTCGFGDLIFLAQALEALGWVDPLRLWVVSNRVCQVESADVIEPIKATILSPCRVIPQEYPHVRCRFLDVGVPLSAAYGATQVFGELQGDVDEAVVAYRGRQRWVQWFERLPLMGDAPEVFPLREQGVYVVIDGLDGVGWALTQYLAQRVHAQVVLLECDGFPDPGGWEGWLAAHAADDVVSRKIQRVRLLEGYGGRVLIRGVRLSDPGDVQRAFDDARGVVGPPHGVVYALGSGMGAQFRPLQDVGAAEYEEQVMPTVSSLAALAQVVEGAQVDFCLCVSSLSAVLGGLGQAIHAAVSVFIDAMAEEQGRKTCIRWVSVDWDVWLPEGAALQGEVASSLLPFAIAPVDGVEAARRVLTQLPDSRVVVSTGDLVVRMEQRPLGFVPSGGSAEGGLRAHHPRPQLASAYVAPRTELERTIVAAWQEVFGLEQIGIDDNFFELGGNSLIAIHSMGHLKKILQVDLPTAMLYQRPTTRLLAELLAQDEAESARRMADQLAKRKAELGRRHQVIQRRR